MLSTGRVKDEPLSQIVLVVNGEKLTGNIRINEKLFQVRPLGEGTHVISELNLSKLYGDCGAIAAIGPHRLLIQRPISAAQRNYRHARRNRTPVEEFKISNMGGLDRQMEVVRKDASNTVTC